MPTAQPCQGMAEKVSLLSFACTVLEAADNSRPALRANGTRPRKHTPSITSRDDAFTPLGAKSRKATGLEASGPFLPGVTWITSRAPFPRERREAGVQRLMTVGPCDGCTAGVTVKPSLLLKSLGHGQPHLQELRPQRRHRRLLQLVRRGNHGQGPQSPPRRPAQEASGAARETSTRPAGHALLAAAALRLVRKRNNSMPALALQTVTI